MAEDEVTDDLVVRPEVARRLGNYVYLYIDPRNEQPFYVGKGQGERALSHLSEEAESRKCARIAELRAEGKEPRIDILAHGLRDEETAFRIEAAIIDLFGLDLLTNEVRGWRSLQLGRIPLPELTMYYAAKPVTVEVPALLIRINRLYRHNMTRRELYEATRGVWKLGARCTKARYAFAVFEGLVREVYEIESWHPAATTPYTTRDESQLKTNGRSEFLGRVADAEIRDKYVGRSVAAEFPQGLQSPVVYRNC
ncbi:MAG TPA: hypothetical protein VE974_08610 [Thermoanaerobaculia bacterium]|nr:hypothetical protein [Thermoanaerobaculia bacterium]